MFEDIAVVPVGDVKTTADAIATVLGLEFQRDPDSYDEFPTYMAQLLAARFDVRGDPDAGHDIDEHKSEIYQLTVHDVTVLNAEEFVTDLVGRLSGAGLQCWRMPQARTHINFRKTWQEEAWQYLAFEPAGNLENTARIAERVIGVPFEKDLEGDFEEYPAYVGEDSDTLYAFLGPPKSEYDSRHEPDHDNELIIRSDRSEGFEDRIADLIKRLLDAGVNCREL